MCKPLFLPIVCDSFLDASLSQSCKIPSDTNKMAGRKPSIPLIDLRVVFSKYKQIFNVAIPPITNEVYGHIQQELRSQFNYEISKKALQISAKRNKAYFFDSGENNDSSIDATAETSDLTVSFEMNMYEYSKIAPVESHHLAQNKWSNEMQDQIFFKTDLECTFSFKNNYVPTDLENNVITCTGSCTQCKASLLLHISPKLADHCVEINLYLKNFKQYYQHDLQSKNKLTSNRVNLYKEKLKHDKPLKVRNSTADKVMSMDNPKEPPTLPKLSNLRKYRHEARSALQFDKNTVLSLYAMAYSPPYDSFIKKFSLVPFFLYFWTDAQSQYYDDILKDVYKILSIDATGSIFQPLTPPEANDYIKYKKDKHIFLYAIVAYTLNASVPICYMASESHTTDTIATWLNIWLNNRVIPNEIICDDSSALIGAITKTFLKINWNDYLKQCFSVVEEEKNNVPACYIRLDKSHFVKKLYKQSCFEKASEKCKFFYIDCIKLIQQLRSYEEIKLIIKDVVSLSLHEYIDDLNNKNSKCVQAFKRLSVQIRTFLKHTEGTDEREDSEKIDFATEDENIEQCCGPVPLINYYDDVVKTEILYLQLAEPTQTRNDLYLPEINNTLKRLLKKLPMWGNIMTKYFSGSKDYASSSNVENHFKDIKTIYFNTKIERVRLDEFLVQHYSFINGAVKLSSSQILHEAASKKAKQYKAETDLKMNVHAKIDEDEKCKIKRKSKEIYENSSQNLAKRIMNEKQNKIVFSSDTDNKLASRILEIKEEKHLTDKSDFDVQSIFQDEPMELENWRGLTIPTPKSTKSNPVYILQNGNVANSKLYQKRVLITNTCAFDSVAQALSVAYKDRPVFREIVNSISDDLTTFLQVLSNTRKSSKRVYELREKILIEIFDKANSQSQLNIIDCECNVTKILQDVFTSSIYFSATRQRCCSNIACSNQSKQNKFDCKYIPLNLNTIERKGIKFLQESATSCIENDKVPLCPICQEGSVRFTYDLKHVLFFELHDTYVLLNDVPIDIELNGQQYLILAVIAFDPPSSPTLIGHYTAYCFRTNTHEFECYDDLYSKIQKCTKSLLPHIIIYTLL